MPQHSLASSLAYEANHRGSGVAEAAVVELLTRQVLQRARLAVIFGGDKRVDGAVMKKRGNPRSWKSYEAVANDIAAALRRLGAAHVDVLPDDMRLGERLAARRIDMAWLNTGGVQGVSSIAHAASLLEMLGIPYVGHDPMTAAILDNKFVFKRQMQAIGVPTSPFIVWRDAFSDPAASLGFARLFKDWRDGFVVKPVSGRASLNVHYVERAQDISSVAGKVITATASPVIIEAYLPGFEYCIAVCGSLVARSGRLERLNRPFTFAAIERVLGAEERIFTSMDHKPITHDRIRQLDPVSDAFTIDTLEEMAARLFREMPLKTLVRLDVRADSRGRLYVLEANPKPDLKAAVGEETSLIGSSLARYGMSYDDLILAMLSNRTAELLDDASGISDAIDQLLGCQGA